MQYSYSALAIAALFSSSFAAPTAYLEEVSSVVGGAVTEVAVCVDSDLTCITKKDLVSGLTSLPIVSTVASDATPVVGSVAGDVTSDLTSLPLVGSTAGGVIVDATSVVGTVGSLARRQLDLVSGLVDNVATQGESVVEGAETEVTSLPLVSSVTSSLPLVKNAVGTVSVLSSAVDVLATAVASEVATLTGLVAGEVTDAVLPIVETSLESIVTSINATVAAIVPVIAGTVLTLAVEEVEAVISTLGQVETMISDIESILIPLVSAVADDALAMITPEIEAILAVVMPLVSPIATFAFSVAGTIVDDDGEGNAIRTAIFEVTGVAGSILSPVTGVVSSL